ncbi:hypothetical protein [Halostella pelagica]|uniref:hypothetical protein n=1 Tax=Halostella pelagica TaxID=2583824 RepID=UPI0010807A78|nr:hypothetical protein [Halostella pelagica]
MTRTVLIARGDTHDERQRCIDTICSWIRDMQADVISTDDVRKLYEYTEENASTVATLESKDAYLYVRPSGDITTDRQGPDEPEFEALKKAGAADGGSNLIVGSLARAPVSDIETIVTDHRVRVHDATHAITIQPTRHDRDGFAPATRRALEVLTGTAESADALLAGVAWQGGRPPLGCTSDGGRLAPDDDYDRVCRALQRVKRGDWSKTKASEKLGCARKTIDNALERPELYRLE